MIVKLTIKKDEHIHALVRLFSLALNSTEQGHNEANLILQKDIDRLKIIR